MAKTHSTPDSVVTIFDGEHFRWRDPQGEVHAIEESRFSPERWLLRTRCLLHDVTDSKAWKGDDQVTCTGCQIMMADLESPPTSPRP